MGEEGRAGALVEGEGPADVIRVVVGQQDPGDRPRTEGGLKPSLLAREHPCRIDDDDRSIPQHPDVGVGGREEGRAEDRDH